MGNILPAYYNKIQYSLTDSLGPHPISEPIGWKDDLLEFKRSPKVHGVFTTLSSKSLKFPKGDENNDGGYNVLKQIFDLEGINARCLLKREVQINSEWIESYRVFLDFSEYSTLNNVAEIKFNESGLNEKIKARQSEKFDLGRLTTMDGDAIDPLNKEIVAYDGRDILIISQLQKSTSNSLSIIPSGVNEVGIGPDFTRLDFNHQNGGQYEAIALPISMVSEQDGNVQTVYDYDVPENENSYGDGKNTGNMFYRDADNDITLKIDFDIELEVFSSYSSGTNVLKLDLVKYENGINYDFKSFETLESITPVLNGKLIFQESAKEIVLLQGESLALAVHSFKSSSSGHLIIEENKGELIIYDETFFEKSQGNIVLPFETLNRTLHIITGEENVLVSNALGRTDLGHSEDGYASLNGITPGLWIRGFDDAELPISHKIFTDSYGAAWQLGYGIEKVGLKETVRVEKIDHFYQSEVTIRIGQLKNIRRSVAKDYVYSGFEVGFEKPKGDVLYEEAMGLDEPNVKNTYTSIISRINSVFKQLSKIRGDSYGPEFARRKPKRLFPETDTRYDKDLFMKDLKRGATEVFEEKKWEDDFVKPSPFNKFTTGIYSPETATNLNLSPINCLLRWGFWIKGGLQKYLDSFIRFGSSDGNSGLTTQLDTNIHPEASGNEYAENGEILVDDLTKSLFIPQYIEGEFPVDDQLMQTLNGTTIKSDGETIMNSYGLVEFINNDRLYEYAFLVNVKPTGKGIWKLLKANKKAVNISTQEVPTNL